MRGDTRTIGDRLGSTEGGTSMRGSLPPGWDVNPSAWGQRLPLVGVAVVGGVIAAYLAAFQLGAIESVWEPFFGDGSRTVLTSGVSRVLPVPDAALGAAGYVLDAVTGVVGGTRRWRTMPWIVLLFGLAVGPLGAISILLVVLQPVLYDAWCTLCLATAVISVVMIGPAMDESLASLQYLRAVHANGGSWWRAFWGNEPGVAIPRRAPERAPEGRGLSLGRSRLAGFAARVAAILAGVWLMASPDVLGIEGWLRTQAQILGPVAVSTAVMAMAEVLKPLRWAAGVVGVWLCISGVVAFVTLDEAAALATAAPGVVLASSALVPGRRRHAIGGGWSSLVRGGRRRRQPEVA